MTLRTERQRQLTNEAPFVLTLPRFVSYINSDKTRRGCVKILTQPLLAYLNKPLLEFSVMHIASFSQCFVHSKAVVQI